jgi:hypothetical protein
MAAPIPSEAPPGAVYVPIGGKYSSHVLIDAADYAFVAQWHWFGQPYGPDKRLCVIRSPMVNGKQVRVVLARELLLPEEGVRGEVRYRNGDPLDCRRDNLDWRPFGEKRTAGDVVAAILALSPAERAAIPAPHGPDECKALGKRLGVTQKDVLALARAHDPFMAGTKGHWQQGRWFKNLLEQLKDRVKNHLRSVHYWLASQKQPRNYDDRKYENNPKFWGTMQMASKRARYLKLVDPQDITDERTAPPRIHRKPRLSRPEPGVYIPEVDAWTLPTLKVDLVGQLDEMELPAPYATGYDYEGDDQPYYLEVHIEKSTMDDILDPICERYGATLVTGTGYLSVTRITETLDRARRFGRPCRIFYVSDFDPAGVDMPVQVARQIQFWRPDLAPYIHFALQPIALTKDQVVEHDLPEIFIKESVKSRERFKRVYGRDATELDALEAKVPGMLAEIVEATLAAYFDDDLEQQLDDADREADEAVDEAWEETTADEREELDSIKADATEILAEFQEKVDALAAEMADRMEPLQQRIDDARQAVQERCHTFHEEVDLPDRPESELEPPDESEYLLDTDLSYLDQLLRFIPHKHGFTTDDDDDNDDEDALA